MLVIFIGNFNDFFEYIFNGGDVCLSQYKDVVVVYWICYGV